MSLPTLFISHGSPMLLVEDTAARDFLTGYAATLPKPHGENYCARAAESLLNRLGVRSNAAPRP